MKKQRRLYRVKFHEKGEKEPLTVTVEHFSPSDYLGLVTLSGFVFKDETKLVVLPGENEVRKRFAKTEKLHLPYHVLISVEEFLEEPEDVKQLPYLKEVVSEEAPKGGE